MEQLLPALPRDEVEREPKRARGAGAPEPVTPAPGQQRPLVDRPRVFSQRAAEALNGALISCEERFPSRGDASVLLVVVENELDRWKKKLDELAAQHLQRGADNDPAPEVRLEVIDRAAADTLRRLAESGIIHPSLRASRLLFPAPEAVPLPLSAQEQNRARQAREQHARKQGADGQHVERHLALRAGEIETIDGGSLVRSDPGKHHVDAELAERAQQVVEKP